MAAAAGLTVLAHPPLALWPLAFGMLAPLVTALEGARPRRAFGLTYVYSAAMGLALVRWLVHALAEQYGVPRVPAWVFTGALVAGLALVPASAAALYGALRPRVGLAAAPLAFSAIWVLGEWVRAEILGVPWLLFGLSLHRFPLALQTADLGGMWAVGFVVVVVNAGLGLAAATRRPGPLAPALAVALLAGGYGAWRMEGIAPESPDEMRVGVIQASLPPDERFQPGTAERNLERHAVLTRQLVGREGLDLVVWPETAIDGDLDRAPLLGALAGRLVDGLGVPLVTGAPRSAGGLTNSVVLFAPGAGLVESYAKQRLVPFSEYDPALAGLLAPILSPLMQGEAYRPGGQATVFRRTPIPLGTPVCFEITYPDMMRAFRLGGARLLLNLSNDAWFGPTGYPEMHFAHVVLRAVELRTWIVRAANTGISGVVDPAGRVRVALPAFETGSIAATVRPAGSPPPYARLGDTPVLTLLAAILLGAASGLFPR